MNRRQTLAAMGTAALAPSILMPGTAHGALDLDPENPKDALQILRKLAHTTDDSVVFWWLRSTRMGLFNSAFTPFWEQIGGTLFMTRDLEDGAYEASALIFVFGVDLETGEEISTFRNPYTGEENDIVMFGATKPIRVEYQPDGGETGATRAGPPGFQVSGGVTVGPIWREGDDVWVRSDNIIRMEPDDPDQGRLSQVNDWNTFHGSWSDVVDPSIASVPATWTFNDINTWPRWMGMGDRTGNYMARGAGRKVFSVDDMPEDWRALMAKHHPDVLADPRGAFSA